MANKYFNEQIHGKAPKGMGANVEATPGGGKTSMRVKQSWSTGLPGKAQSKSRSGGVKKAKTYSHSEGL